MIKKINKFFNPKLESLIFFVTTRCPLKCKHCFYTSELNKPEGELSLEEIKKISNNLPNLRLLQLSGGEPFVREDLVELIEIFFQNGIEKVYIPTNGFFTNKIIRDVKKMKEKDFNFQIMISLDGFKDYHNELRGMDCFDKALKTFDELKKIGVDVGFNASLGKTNYNSHLDFLKFLRTKTDKIDSILIRESDEITLSSEEFKEIYPKIEKILSNKTSSKFYKKRAKMLNELYHNSLSGKKLPFKCLAGQLIAVLEPDGQVRACEIFGKLGNVRDYNYDINEILKLKQIPSRCRGCIHPCFIAPSMSYNAKWLLKNIIFQYV